MSVWVMVFIGGLLCTQIANPFFWYRIAKSVTRYNYAIKEFHTNPDGCCKPTYLYYLEKDEIGGIKLAIVSNIVCFLVCSGILWLIYYFGVVDRTISMMATTAWIFSIGSVISCYLTFGDARRFRKVEYWQAFAYSIVMMIICIVLPIHTGIYNFNNHINANVILTETEVPVISIDVSTTLEKEILIQGYTIQEPINRNGKVIFPLLRGGNISIAGYVELINDSTPIIVLKDLHYTPYQSGSQNIMYVARDYLPTNQFFGDWTFQLAPDGDVYFAKMYGDFAFLRGGRVVTGVLLINGTTGKCSTYPINKVPKWINGISE